MTVLTVVLLTATDVLALLLNALVIFNFMKIKNQLMFRDYLMTGMAISDILQCLLGYPLEIYSSRNGYWMFDTHSCMASGFFITFLGLVSINYLAVIATDLYCSICKPYFAAAYHENRKYIVAVNAFAWLASLFWAITPILGWSSYHLEADGLRCSINWKGQSAADKSYIACLFFFCYILPIGVMLFSFISVKREIRRMQGRVSNMTGPQAEARMESIRAEKKHTRLAIVMCLAFLISWTPYAVISFWSSYFQHVSKTPTSLGTISAVLAKMSAFANPIIYSFLHPKFRRSLKALFLGNRRVGTSAISDTGPKQISTCTPQHLEG